MFVLQIIFCCNVVGLFYIYKCWYKIKRYTITSKHQNTTDAIKIIHLAIDLDRDFDQLYNALYTRFTTAEAYSIFPDVLSTLNELKQHGFHMGVISNSDERVGKVAFMCIDKFIIC